MQSSRNHEVDRLRALALLVRLDLEADALSFGQILQSGAFHRGDVNEHVAAAVVRLDEAVAAFAVEELDRPCHGHREPSPVCFAVTRQCRVRPDRTIAAGKHGHLDEPQPSLRYSPGYFWPLLFRRNHSRKRNVKPVPTPSSIIRFPAGCLWL